MAHKSKFEFDKVFANLQMKKSTLPIQIANIAQFEFLNNFRTESFFGKKWKQVKRKEKPVPKSDPGAHDRGILQGRTRDMFHSVAHSIREANWRQVKLGTSVSYAEYHNDGTAKIPRRRFMGDHPILRAKIRKQIEREIKSIFVT